MSNGQAVKINNYQRPVDLLEISKRGQQAKRVDDDGTGDVSFKEMFSREMSSTNQVSFSKHASQRLHSRGIEITDELIGQISDALTKADSKGSKETLILTDDVALVASVKSRTIITAFDKENLREGIVTSIDSAVII